MTQGIGGITVGKTIRGIERAEQCGEGFGHMGAEEEYTGGTKQQKTKGVKHRDVLDDKGDGIREGEEYKGACIFYR